MDDLGYPMFFLWFFPVWFVIGLPAMSVIVWYRWQKLGLTITLGDVLGVLVITLLAGGLLYGFIILYFLFEVVDWKRPVLRGRDNSRGRGSYY